MKLTRTQRLILFSLGQFYQSINQPLTEKPLKLRTSKITFIELLLSSGSVGKQERSFYKNLESLEKSKLITYEKRMIRLTDKGLKILEKINKEIKQFTDIKTFFSDGKIVLKRKLQTTISD